MGLISLFAIIFMFLFVCDKHDKQEQFFYIYALSADEKGALNNGDIILREGYGFVSEAIVKKLNERYPVSHCGIVVKDSANAISIIHSLSGSLMSSDGVQQCSLAEFEKDSRNNSIIIVRLKEGENEKIAQKAQYYLQKKVPFDHSFDLSDSSHFFCSELIIRILQDEYQIDITNKQSNDCKFEIFLNPSYFDVIINHRLK